MILPEKLSIKKVFKKQYNLLIVNGTSSAYNNNKIIYYSKKVRL